MSTKRPQMKSPRSPQKAKAAGKKPVARKSAPKKAPDDARRPVEGLAYIRPDRRKRWPKEFQDDMTIYAPQNVYNATRRATGAHVQIGVTFKHPEDIELWEDALAAFPEETKVGVVRRALHALLKRR